MLKLAKAVLFCVLVVMANLLHLAAAAAKPADPATVKIGALITSLSDLEPADGSFRIAGYMWFIAPDDSFDPTRDIQLLARTQQMTVLEMRQQADGRQYSAVYFDAVVDTQFNVVNYPFDAQTLKFVIASRIEANTLKLAPDTQDSGLSDVVEVAGWVVGDLRLVSSYRSYRSGFGYQIEHPSFSRVAFTVDVERKRSPLIFEKFTGFLVALVITALAFAVPASELGTRLGMLTSAVFAAVFNLNRLQDSIGFDASFGLVDRVSMIAFSAILSSLAFSLFIHRRSQVMARAATARLNRRFCLGFVVLFGTLLTAAFWQALR